MQIILASAKIMNTQTERSIPSLSTPIFIRDAQQFALELANFEVEELMKMLKCNAKLALETKLRYQDFFNEDNFLPALFAYYGQAYKTLDANTLTPKDITYANQHLWILSFLYGMLRPCDAIHSYRLEGNVKLEINNEDTFFAYWKPKLTDMLISAVKNDDGVLMHLATEEFEHLFDWKRVVKELCVIKPKFLVEKNGVLKNVTVHSKSCRGRMTRYILQNEITNVEDLTHFEYNGFHFADELSCPAPPSSGLIELLWKQ